MWCINLADRGFHFHIRMWKKETKASGLSVSETSDLLSFWHNAKEKRKEREEYPVNGGFPGRNTLLIDERKQRRLARLVIADSKAWIDHYLHPWWEEKRHRTQTKPNLELDHMNTDVRCVRKSITKCIIQVPLQAERTRTGIWGHSGHMLTQTWQLKTGKRPGDGFHCRYKAVLWSISVKWMNRCFV